MEKVSTIVVGCMLTLVVIFGLFFVTQPIFADGNGDHEYREYYGKHKEHHKYEAIEESGELLGWGTVIAMGGALVLMPFRRNASKLMKAFPSAKGVIRSIIKFLTKSHIWIGVVAIGLSAIHGILLFLHEGEFESEIVLGMISFCFMAIAAIFGAKLAKHKSLKNIRSIHIGLIVGAVLIAAVHILRS